MLRAADQIQVLPVIDTLGVGGTELGLANVIAHTRNRIAHAVCCVRAGGATAERLAAEGIPITMLHKRPGNDWSLPVRFARLCRQAAPDIVHTRNWGSVDAIIGARLAGVPVVIHGEHGRDAADPNGTNRRRNWARRALSMFSDRMVAVSDQLRHWLIDEVGIRESKVEVLKNGVDVDKFQRRGDRAALRRSHGYSPEDIVVGTVGRLDPVKNQKALLEVAAALSAAHPYLRVVIVGEGPERAALSSEIARRNLRATAILLGQRDDVSAMLSMFDVFVLPSLGEGMCNTILEAMAVGLPVVATGVGGNPELVADGTTGQLVPVRDAGALAQAIARYVSDEPLRRRHGAAGRQRVVEEFTLQGMADRYARLYEREVGRKRCAA
jgi:sugar transferase (PEP-CTERM/EpsH1 system associated)